MKFIGKFVSFAVKLVLLVSAVVLVLELIDNLRPEHSSRYLFSEDFSD